MRPDLKPAMAIYLVLAVVCHMTHSVVSQNILGKPGDVPGINHDLDLEWKQYMVTFNKTYTDSSEALLRRYIWEDNLAVIQKHNLEHANGLHTYTMGVNDFTDLTFDEFSARYLSPERPARVSFNHSAFGYVNGYYVNDVKDWREEGAVTPVKNQGACGSCWAFSTTGSIEGQVKLHLGKLVPLSEQMLVDCCTKYNHGCNGGIMDRAFECVQRLGGIESETDYPYRGVKGQCHFSRSRAQATVTGYISKSGQTNLHAVVQSTGPASVALFASKNLMHYETGIFSDATCNHGQVNHGVLAVGYGDGYWLVKNSWGTRWGMEGYFKIKRDNSALGMCMIATEVSVPKVAKAGQ